MKTDNERKKDEPLYREMDLRFEPGSARATREDGTADDRIPIAMSSEIGVERHSYWEDATYLEILDHSKGAVDLSYSKDGLPFLLNHDIREQIGLIEDVTLDDDRKLRGMVRFSKSQRAQEIRQDIVDGIRKKISVGYRLADYEEKKVDDVIERRYRGWTPMEASSVPIPADYSVGVGRSAPGAADFRRDEKAPTNNTASRAKEQAVSDKDTAAQEKAAATEAVRVVERNERVRAESIIALANEHGFAARASEWVGSDKSVETVQKEILVGLRERLKNPTPQQAPVEFNEKERKQYSFARAIAAHIPEMKIEAGFEREVEQDLEKKVPKEYKARGGVLLPTLTTRAGLDSITATKGTELKFTQPGEFIDLLRAKMRLRQLGARVLSGLTGPVSFPKQTAAASGSWVAENPGSDVADSNLLVALVTLAIKTYQASTSFSRQLLVSAISGSVDAEQMVRDDLSLVNALAFDKAGIDGSGASNQPRGVINTSGIGSVAGGTNGAAPTYANIVDLETAVAAANADDGTLGYLTTPTMRGKLKQTQQFAGTNGVPVWVGKNEVNGYNGQVSTQVPSALVKGTSSDCHAIIFGDFSQMIFGEWGVLELVVDPFRLKKQGMIEVTSFMMGDVAIRQAAAFAAMLDARNV
jgi:HK97 family phage major capsid protein